MPAARTPETTQMQVPLLYRSAEIDLAEVQTRGEGDAAQRSYAFTVSSDAEIPRYNWRTGRFFIEILSHEESAIDTTYLRSGLSILADGHWGPQVGIFEHGKVVNKKIRGDGRFSRNQKGQDIERDVQDGIRKYVSIGYKVIRSKLLEVRKDGVEVFLATRWMPAEVTILPVPADASVGLMEGRAGDQKPTLYDVEIEAVETTGREESAMPTPNDPNAALETRSAEGAGAPPAAPPQAPPPAPPAAPPAIAGRSREEEGAAIAELANANNMSERAADWLRRGLSREQVSYEILQARRTAAGATPPAEEHLHQLPEKDRSKYSYRRAIAMMVERGPGAQFDGVEGELHTELRRALPDQVKQHGGIHVPMRLRTADEVARQTRALTTTAAGGGAELVNAQPGEIIEILRAQSYVFSMGAQLMTGLTGPVPMTKRTGGLTVHWVPENPDNDVASSDLAFGLVTLLAKTMQGTSAYSRQALNQEGSHDIEGMIREEIGFGHSLAFDRAFLHGSGVNGQPLGIYGAPDVQIVAVTGVPTFGELIDAQGKVHNANALRGTLGYMTTPLMAAKLRQTLESAVAGATWIWTGRLEDGFVAGYRATSTNQVSSVLGTGLDEHGLIYGNWREAVGGLWGSLELIFDPFSQKKKGLIEITSFQMGDAIFRHGQSFVKFTGATLT